MEERDISIKVTCLIQMQDSKELWSGSKSPFEFLMHGVIFCSPSMELCYISLRHFQLSKYQVGSESDLTTSQKMSLPLSPQICIWPVSSVYIIQIHGVMCANGI